MFFNENLIDFEDSLTDIAKSEGTKAANDLIAKSGLPTNIPGIGSISNLISGISSGNTKDIITGAASTGLGIVGTVFGGPVGGAVGENLGKLLGGFIPKTAKEKRIIREGARTKEDLKRLALTPVTDSNIIDMFESGKIIIGLGRRPDGTPVPGTQSKNEYKFYQFTGGKQKKIGDYSNIAAIVKLIKDKNLLNTGSNVIGLKLIAAYKAVKDAKTKTDKAGIINKSEQVKQKLTEQLANQKIIKGSVDSAIKNSGISASLKSLIDTEKITAEKLAKHEKTINQFLDKIVKKQSNIEIKSKNDNIILGNLITKSAVESMKNGASLTALENILKNNAAVPTKYQNLLGGAGLIKLVNKNG